MYPYITLDNLLCFYYFRGFHQLLLTLLMRLFYIYPGKLCDILPSVKLREFL